jgi:hypothetical protein
VNSSKGMALLGRLSALLDLTESTLEQASAQNARLKRPTLESDKRETVLRAWREGGYRAVADQYYKSNRKWLIMVRIRMLIPRPVKRFVKKLLGRA